MGIAFHQEYRYKSSFIPSKGKTSIILTGDYVVRVDGVAKEGIGQSTLNGIASRAMGVPGATWVAADRTDLIEALRDGDIRFYEFDGNNYTAAAYEAAHASFDRISFLLEPSEKCRVEVAFPMQLATVGVYEYLPTDDRPGDA